MARRVIRKGGRVMIRERRNGFPLNHYLIPNTVAVAAEDQNRITGSLLVEGECSMPEFFKADTIEQRLDEDGFRVIR